MRSILSHYSTRTTQFTWLLTVCPDWHQRKYQNSASLALCEGRPVDSPHKGPATRKVFPFHDGIMNFTYEVVVVYDHCTNLSVYVLKPRSHIACNRSATSLRPKFRVVAGRLQGGCKDVGVWSPTGRRRLQGRFGRKEALLLQVKPLCDQIDPRTVFGGRRQVADWSPTGWRLIAYQLQRLQTIPTQFLVADWSPTSHRSVADRFRKSCRLSAIKNKRSRYSRQPVADQSPIGCRSPHN